MSQFNTVYQKPKVVIFDSTKAGYKRKTVSFNDTKNGTEPKYFVFKDPELRKKIRFESGHYADHLYKKFSTEICELHFSQL